MGGVLTSDNYFGLDPGVVSRSTSPFPMSNRSSIPSDQRTLDYFEITDEYLVISEGVSTGVVGLVEENSDILVFR